LLALQPEERSGRHPGEEKREKGNGKRETTPESTDYRKRDKSTLSDEGKTISSQGVPQTASATEIRRFLQTT
jgi:hypothetical protein